MDERTSTTRQPEAAIKRKSLVLLVSRGCASKALTVQFRRETICAYMNGGRAARLSRAEHIGSRRLAIISDERGSRKERKRHLQSRG